MVRKHKLTYKDPIPMDDSSLDRFIDRFMKQHVKPGMMLSIINMVDEDFDNYSLEIQSIKKKDMVRWKGSIREPPSGKLKTIRYDAQLDIFYHKTSERLEFVVPRREHEAIPYIQPTGPDNSEAISVWIDANATGNHSSRHHTIRIPTKNGEPVRG